MLPHTTNLCAEVSVHLRAPAPRSPAGSSGIFYVLNQGTKQIVGYSIASGVLTQVGNAYTLSAAPYSIAIAPGGSFLYVGTATGIYLFDIGSSGALTLANNSNVISQDIATTMQVDSTGSWLAGGRPQPRRVARHSNQLHHRSSHFHDRAKHAASCVDRAATRDFA